LNDDGTLNANAGPFAGQKRFDARYTVTEELTKLGLFVKKEPNPMKVPLCSKSKDVIEPLMKPQWWLNMKEMGEAGLKAVQDGQITIAPDTARRSYQRWLEGINDWCLSRQLWWGHRIPAVSLQWNGLSHLVDMTSTLLKLRAKAATSLTEASGLSAGPRKKRNRGPLLNSPARSLPFTAILTA
jgi:valyl-tRNA synthetase